MTLIEIANKAQNSRLKKWDKAKAFSTICNCIECNNGQLTETELTELYRFFAVEKAGKVKTDIDYCKQALATKKDGRPILESIMVKNGRMHSTDSKRAHTIDTDKADGYYNKQGHYLGTIEEYEKNNGQYPYLEYFMNTSGYRRVIKTKEELLDSAVVSIPATKDHADYCEILVDSWTVERVHGEKKIIINIEYLKKILSIFKDDEEIDIYYKPGLTPLHIMSRDGRGVHSLIMPVREA